MSDPGDDEVTRLQSVGAEVGDEPADGDDGPGLLVRAFGVLGLAVVAGAIGVGLMGSGPAPTADQDRFVEVILATEIGYAVAAAGVFQVHDVEGELGLTRRPAPGTAVRDAVLPGAVLGAIAIAITATMIDGRTAVGPVVGPGAEDQASAILLAMVPLSIVAIAPAEELFFRGFAQRYVAETTDAQSAIVVAAIVFTLLHVPQHLQVDPAGVGLLMLGVIFLVGAAAGRVYERTGSLLAPIALHATYNCVIAGTWYLELEYGVLPV